MTRKEIQEAAKQIVSDKNLIDRAVATGKINDRDAMMARFGLRIRMKTILLQDTKLREIEGATAPTLAEELMVIFLAELQ